MKNMQVIASLRERSGAKILLALKCFATWSVFDMMSQFMDGTTSSSLFEVRLGHEKFGKESHAYSVAWSDDEIDAAIHYADKIIFNSINQLNRFQKNSQSIQRGLRINPKVSSSAFDIADPACPFSRLGESNPQQIEKVIHHINGFMIHNNCENNNFYLFNNMLNTIEEKFSYLFSQVEWISLGGGIHFTADHYPINSLAKRLKYFSEKYNILIYLEPGEASITNSTTLEVSVLDTFNNGKEIAIVDSSIESHMPDLLIYRESAKIKPNAGQHEIMICGKSCLAGDIFGTFFFPSKLKIGDRISIQDAGGYTMVKKNWFNGLNLPSLAIRELDKSIQIVQQFTYQDYLHSLS